MSVNWERILAFQANGALTIVPVSTVFRCQLLLSHHRWKDVLHPRLNIVTNTVLGITQIVDIRANVWKMKVAKDNVMNVIQV